MKHMQSSVDGEELEIIINDVEAVDFGKEVEK